MKNNIIEVARLIRYLGSEDYTPKAKTTELKAAVANGLLTTDDAIDLICEFDLRRED